MKRAGCLLFAAAPVLITALVYVVSPDGSTTSDTVLPEVSASQETRREAKARAEDEREAENKLVAAAPPGLAAPKKKELAQKLISSAVHSTLQWRTAYGYIEDLGDGQGYTAGIVGFCTGTHDLLTLVERYTKAYPDNGLARFLPALRKVDGTDSHEGLDPGFTEAWRKEAEVPAFRKAQETERDRVYFEPAVRLAKLDGLGTLGQFLYYDAMVFHGNGTGRNGFYEVRERAVAEADTPAEGGREKTYLDRFLDIRRKAMKDLRPPRDTSRIDTAQRQFLYDGNLDLDTPLSWKVYGDPYHVP